MLLRPRTLLLTRKYEYNLDTVKLWFDDVREGGQKIEA